LQKDWNTDFTDGHRLQNRTRIGRIGADLSGFSKFNLFDPLNPLHPRSMERLRFLTIAQSPNLFSLRSPTASVGLRLCGERLGSQRQRGDGLQTRQPGEGKRFAC
jgi:hypothetical protein